jgi:hypothetical protein
LPALLLALPVAAPVPAPVVAGVCEAVGVAGRLTTAGGKTVTVGGGDGLAGMAMAGMPPPVFKLVPVMIWALPGDGAGCA